MFVLLLKKIKLECTRTGSELEKKKADRSHITSLAKISGLNHVLLGMDMGEPGPSFGPGPWP
jgi:hypothetical protein